MFVPIILEITRNFPENIKKDIGSLLSPLDYNPIWQTIEWQTMLRETGYTQKSFFVGIYENKKLASYTLAEKRGIGFGKYGFFCIGGPIVREEKSLQILSETLGELGIKEKAVFIQTEPLSPIILPDFKTGYHKNFIEKHTAIIDLTQDDETILAHMKPK